jgi:D-alanyl-D-alanine carboxypeptidase
MDRLDAYVSAEMDRLRIPGLSLGVVRGGEVALAKGYGLAHVERSVPATAQTVYRLASITKTIAATAAMMLVEQAMLHLDDPVTAHLPELPAEWQAITVRHLLTHTSGLEDWENVPPHLPVKEPLLAETPDGIIRFLSQFPLRFPPGERWEYSNSGYLLLGRIIERVSGKRLDLFLDEVIFRPLGMAWTAYGFHELNLLATGYVHDVSTLKRLHPTEAWGHGGLVSTVMDLARWDAALDTDQLLSPESRQPGTRAAGGWTPAKLNDGTEVAYGLGWDIRDTQGRKIVGHGGGRVGVSTRIARDLENRLTVLLLIPLAGVDTWAMVAAILERCRAALI